MLQVRVDQVDMAEVGRDIGMTSIEANIFVAGVDFNMMRSYNMACIADVVFGSNRCVFGCIGNKRCVVLSSRNKLSSIGLSLSNSA